MGEVQSSNAAKSSVTCDVRFARSFAITCQTLGCTIGVQETEAFPSGKGPESSSRNGKRLASSRRVSLDSRPGANDWISHAAGDVPQENLVVRNGFVVL